MVIALKGLWGHAPVFPLLAVLMALSVSHDSWMGLVTPSWTMSYWASTRIPITPYLRLFPPVTLFLGDSVQVKWPRSRGKTASSIFKWWLRCHTTMNAECSTKQAQLTSVIKLHNSGRYKYDDYYCYSSKRTKQCVHLTRCQFVEELPDAYPILDHLALGWTYMKEHKVSHLPI